MLSFKNMISRWKHGIRITPFISGNKYFQSQHRQSSNNGWVRPIVPKEEWHDRMQRSGMYIMVLATRFSACREISEEEARTVMQTIYRRIYNLRLRFGDRNGQRWLREMPEEKIDFEMLHDADPKLVCNEMMHRGFNSDSGPLWTAKLLPWSEKSTPFETSCPASPQDFEESTQCVQPTASKHPHRYHLLFSYHHAFLDGFSCLTTLRFVITLLDRLLEGKSIADEEHVGEFFDMSKKLKACEEISQRFRDDPRSLEARKKATEECLVRPLLLDAFPVEPVKELSTELIYNFVNEQTTKKFLNLCKQIRSLFIPVSVH